MEQIITAKERQAAEANKAANSLLKEIDMEKTREQTRKVAAAKKREKRKAKKKGKHQTTAASTETNEDVNEPATVEEQSESVTTTTISTVRTASPPPVVPSTVENTSVPSTSNIVMDEEDIRTQMVKGEKEQKVSVIEPVVKPSLNSNKKKTNTMTRKMERHQENLASKTKQQQQQESPSNSSTVNIVDDGWQEVIGKQKKITIPHEQYSRVIGRSGSNLNVLREVTGASIDVENKKGIGDKTIVIK